MPKKIRVGLLGCGVVGGGVVEALYKNGDYIEAQTGIRFEIVRIAVRDLERERAPHVNRKLLCDNWQAVCEASDIDVVIEAMGGLSPGAEAVATAIQHGKHVITANKELLAVHGEKLFALTERHNVHLRFEASVLGGIPALHGLQTYFVANRLTQIRGIVNGTSNYILTQMTTLGKPFAEALLEAQEKGYAEPDPTMDIEGYDAMFKLQILIRFALGDAVDVQELGRLGIAAVDEVDLHLAKRLGFKIKHVAQATVDDASGKLYASVGPMFVDSTDPLYSVDGVQNALCMKGDIVGEVTFAGPGAGAFPTASAVIEDLIKVVTPSAPIILTPSELVTVQRPRMEACLVRKLNGNSKVRDDRSWLNGLNGVRSIAYLSDLRPGVEAWVIQGTGLAAEELVASLSKSDPLAQVACYPVSKVPEWISEISSENPGAEVIHSAR